MDLWHAQVLFLGDLIEDDFSDLHAAKRWAEVTMRAKNPSLMLQWHAVGNAQEADSSPNGYAHVFLRA